MESNLSAVMRTLLVICLCTVSTLGVTPEQITFLQDYGYLEPPDPNSGSLKSQASLIKSIKDFQEFSGLTVTGKIDDKTMIKFKQSRCGMKDIRHKKREKRYVHQGSKWHKKSLTYQIVNWSNDLSRSDIQRTVRKALLRWEKASQIRFQYKPYGTADIMIKFTRKKHNDQYPFDGPGGTLAHAFYPGYHPLSGDTHFDDDETFTLRSQKGKNFYWVALHEFGHALGMDHTKQSGTVMYPWYNGYKGYDVDLSDDDKRGLQVLYGKPKVEPIEREENTKSNIPDDQCVQSVKTIFMLRRETIVINKDKAYLYDSLLKRKKGPIKLSDHFSGLTEVDAAYTLPNGRTVFFHGDLTWEFRGQRRQSRPKYSTRVFGDGIFDIDAAFYWSLAKKVYIFKGHVYWRYDPYRRRMDNGYPKKIKDSWVGVPDDIDSVYEWNKKVYFFKGDKFYRFDNKRMEVRQHYPLQISKGFLVCKRLPRHGRITSQFDQTKDSQSTGNIMFPWIWLLLPSLVMSMLL